MPDPYPRLSFAIMGESHGVGTGPVGFGGAGCPAAAGAVGLAAGVAGPPGLAGVAGAAALGGVVGVDVSEGGFGLVGVVLVSD